MADGAAHPSLVDLELERALIGLMLVDNSNLDHLGDLGPEHLTDPVLSATLVAALDLRANAMAVNLVTLKHRLQGIPLDDNSTGLDVVRGLSFGPAAPPVIDVVAALRDLAKRRQAVEYHNGIAEAVADRSKALSALCADAIGQLNDLVADAVSGERSTFRLYEGAGEFINRLQEDRNPIEITTGLKDLDEITGGHHRDQFTVLGGRTSMGKSAVAIGSALRTALRGHGVIYFALEMAQEDINARVLADLAFTCDSPLAYADFKPKRVNDHDVARLERARAVLKDLPLLVDTQNGLTAGDILARARKADKTFRAEGRALALVVVDHLGKVRASNRYKGQPVKELDEISEAMCVMAKSLNVAVLGLHQINRQVETRENQRPTLADLRGSGALEQDADVVLFVYRPAYQYERQLQDGAEAEGLARAKLEACKHDLELQVAKQRNGPTRTLKLFCDMTANVVRDKEWRR